MSVAVKDPKWVIRLTLKDEQGGELEVHTTRRLKRSQLYPYADQLAARMGCTILKFAKYQTYESGQEVVRTTHDPRPDAAERMNWMDKLAGVDPDIGEVEELRA